MMQIHHRTAVYGVSALLLGALLSGCGSNGATETATAPSTEARHMGASGDGVPKDDHDAQIRAAIGPFFPGAKLVAKPFPFDNSAAAHLSEQFAVKFSGKEGHWQVFDAVKNGQRVGLGVMTHSALPDGKDMHIAFGVNPDFSVVGVTPLDAPDNAKMSAFTAQLRGNTHKSAFKVGSALKTVPGLKAPIAQIGADAVHKGLAILEENFNPQHATYEAVRSPQSRVTHQDSDGHVH